MNGLSIPVIVMPENLQKALGHDGARELVEVVGQVAASKVDRTDFAAFLSAIKADIEVARSDLRLEIHKALLKGVVWVVGTIIATISVQTAVLSYFLRH